MQVRTRPVVITGLLSLVFTPWAIAQTLFESGFEAVPEMVLTKIAPETTNGSVTTYTIEYIYSAESIAPAENVVLTDAIPAGMTYVPFSATGGGMFSAGILTWNLPNLNPGDSGSESFLVSVLVDGVYENTAELTYSLVTERMVSSNTTITNRDTEPPVVTIIGPDGSTVNGATTVDSTPTFEYLLAGDPVAVECRVDLDMYEPCPLPLGSFTTPTLSIGEHTVRVRATDLAGNAGTYARSFFVNAPAVVFSPQLDPIKIGAGLQVSLEVSLDLAPTSALQVDVTVQDTSVALISSDPFLAGGGLVTFFLSAETISQTFYIQGLSNVSSTVLTAQASGYNDANTIVDLDPSGFFILLPSSIETSAGAGNTDIAICAARLDPITLNWVEVQKTRGGSPVAVTVASTDPGVGIVSPNPVIFTPNLDCPNTQFQPVAPGSTTIGIVTPAGFDTPSSLTSIPALVTP